MALNLSTAWSKIRWTLLYLPLLILFSSPAVGSDFTSGCTDAVACNYNPAANEDDGSCDYCSCVEPSYSLTIEEFAADIVDGYTTYRFYLNMVNEDDFLSSVFGNSEDPMSLNFSEGFYNSQFGSAVASGINPAFIAFFPELAADSWITIGIDSTNEGGEVPISTVEDPNQPFVNHFSFGTPQDGQNVVINSASGGAWYVLNNTPNGLPDDFGRVLAMQVSTTAEFWGNMNFQIYQNGDGSQTINSSIEFDGTGTFYPAGINPGPSCGCTDSAACNFNSGAAYDDGSCIYSIPETACDCEGTMPNEGYNCDGTCTSDSDGDGICDLFEGCTDEASVNYDPTALDDDGSCIPFTYGLTLQGILDLTVPEGGVAGKAIHLRTSQDIPDLSYFGVGIANNGGGSDGIEYTFPVQDIPAGVDILVVQNEAAMANYFGECYAGFDYVFVDGSGTINHNGDDAVELFEGGILIETFGDVNVDGTGQPWEYTDSWAFKTNEAWTYGGVNCTDGSTTTQTSNCVYPHCQNLVSVEFEIDFNGTPYPNEEFNQVMVNGNWNGWEPFGLILGDSDGDGVWTGSMSFEDGQLVEFVIALAGPADNSGWGLVFNAPESCAYWYGGPDNSTYGFTAAPNTTVSYCAGTCLPAGSCEAYEGITFQVDLSQAEVTGDVTLFAEFNEWAYPGIVMSDADGNGIYSITVEGVTPGDWLYRFGIDGELETLDPEAPCVGWIDESFVQRSMTYAGGHLELPPVCWESCGPCEDAELGCTDSEACNYNPAANEDDGSCAYAITFYDCAGNCLNDADNDGVCDEFEGISEVDIEFQVDLNELTASFDQIYVSGSFDGWCGTCYMMEDDDNDGIYNVSVTLSANSYFEYKFVLDGWGGEEQLSLELSCVIESSGFVNRTLETGVSNETLPAVCWESCDPCETAGLGCTDPTACNYDANATEDDGSCALSGMSISIEQNYWSSETGVNVKRVDDDEVIFSFSPGSLSNGMDINEDFCLVDGDCYYVEITDTFGDGLGSSGTWSVNWNSLSLMNGGFSNGYLFTTEPFCFTPNDWTYCNDANASNYDPDATTDWNCLFIGCTNPLAGNYDPIAEQDDGSCVFELNPLQLNGILSITSNAGAYLGSAIHLRANEFLDGAEGFGLGVANGGGGSDGVEYEFQFQNVQPEDDILVVRSQEFYTTYFGSCIADFEHIIIASSWLDNNGDDAIELFHNGDVIETFGNPTVDGTGADWDYTGTWAFRIENEWEFGTPTCSDAPLNELSSCPYPQCTGANEVPWPQIGQTIQSSGSLEVGDIAISDQGDAMVVTYPFGSKADIYDLTPDSLWALSGSISMNALWEESTAISGDGHTVAFANNEQGQPGIDVYMRTGSVWGNLGDRIEVEGVGDKIALALSEDGSRLIYGVMHGDYVHNNAGFARVLEWDGNGWSQLGNDFYGGGQSWYLGNDVAISNDGNTIAIASLNDGTAGHNKGSCTSYEWTGNTWIQKGNQINGVATYDQLHAIDMSADGNRLVLGSFGNDSGGNRAGQIRFFDWNVSNQYWNSIGTITGTFEDQRLGTTVCISGNGEFAAADQYELWNGGIQQYRIIGDNVTVQADFAYPCDNCHFGASIDFNYDGTTLAANTWWDPEAGTISDGTAMAFQIHLPEEACQDENACNFEILAPCEYESCTCEDLTSISFGGDMYPVEAFAGRCWFKSNLQSQTFADGSPIPFAADAEEWASASTTFSPIMCAPLDDESLMPDYGALYGYYTIEDERGLCPSGWLVASDEDWKALESFLGMSESDLHSIGTRTSGSVGQKLKASPSDLPAWDGLDLLGFQAVPTGMRSPNGSFESQWEHGSFTSYWTSTTEPGGARFYRDLLIGHIGIPRWSDGSNYGTTIRCVKGISGCTNPDDSAFNPEAHYDDGSCQDYLGCTVVSACNFDPGATADDGSCVEEGECGCDFTDADGDGLVDCIDPCTDPNSCNFESGNLDEEGCDYSCVCQDEAACNFGEPVGVGTLGILVECWEFNFEAYNYPMWYVEGEDSEGYIDSWVGHAPDMFFNEGFGLDACWTIQSMDIPSFFEGELWITLMDTENGTPYFQDTILLDQNLPFDIEICASDYVNDGCTYPLDNLDCSGECINDADGDAVCDEYEVFGCQDEAACNFNPQATEEDFSCLYPEEFYDCEGMCLNDYNADGICDELEITTCEDELACNYGTTIATASEIHVIIFGTNSNFLVDNSWTVEFDGEVYDSGFPGEVSFVTTAVDSCMDISFNLDLAFFEGTFDVILLGEGALGVEFYLEESFDISGLTTHTICISDFLTECEFPEFALNCDGTCMSDIDDDGICDEFEIAGCTEAAACNYNPEATDEDGSCTYPAPGYNCDGSCDDSDGDGVCDSEEVVGCTIASACNFNPLATQENGTCYFADEFEDCDGNCMWESVATGACGELAGLACDGYTFGISPASGGCSFHKTGYFVDQGAVGTAFWQSEYDVASIEEAASVFVEPNDGQLAWINADGLTGGLGSCNELVVPQVSNALKVDMEGNHGVILRNNGTVASFAPSSAYDALEQTPIIFNYFVIDACAGADFNLAVDGSQNILYWGIPNFALQNDYMEVPHAGGFVQVSAYGHAAAAITEYGELVVWGDEPGIVDNAPNAISDAVSVALGDGFGIVLHENGDVTQWGTNDAMPAPPTGLGNIIELTASKDQVLAQASDGTFVSWGVNTIPDDPTPYTPLSNISVDIEFCIPGCTSPDYHNYDPSATIDDGSCNNIGCTVAEALNFEPWATDDDGSCIILGCTDPLACNFNPEAQYGIRLDEIAVHDGTVGTSDLSGYTTYHVVLTGPNPSDRLSAVMGDANTPLSWQITDGDIWNELLIGDVVPNINTAFIGFIPELAYDSWVTIGVDPYSYNPSEAVMVVESSEQPWIDEFEAGNGIEMSDGYGGAWFVAGAQTTGLFGEDQEVLLAQITTNGQLYMASMNIQILPASLGTDDVQLFYEHDLHACSYPDDLLDCDGTCINDADQDGVCDENEVPGCTNAAACNYSDEATDDDGSCIVFEEAIELSVETVVNHTGPGSLNGRSTHRLYANMHNADERVSAVIGFEEHPLLIEQGNGLMYQDVLGGPTPAPLTPAVLSLYPDAAFDSYVALGRGHEDLPTAVQILSGEENWDEFFEIGLPIEISSVVGGGWYSTDVNDGLPEGEDHRVLLGQFTTFGGIQGQVSIQYFDCNGNEVVVHDLLFASENNTAGCMDIAACNYNSEATIDDGTCCFASCATISGFDAVVLSDLIDENPVTLTSTSEVNGTQLFEYCLAPSCYLVSGTNPTAISASWNGIDVSDDVFQFGVLGDPDSPCVGCTDNGACNYEASTIFNDESCEFLAGDFNGDLASTVEDMLLLLAEFNNCELPDECQTDIDDSGFVSVEDLLLFLSYFGSSCGE